MVKSIISAAFVFTLVGGCAVGNRERLASEPLSASPIEQETDLSAVQQAAREEYESLTQKGRRRYAPAEADDIRMRVNAAQGALRNCINDFISDHRRRVYQACERGRQGNDVSGGCAHKVGLTHISVLDRALSFCEGER